ncbi:MAG: DUF362 domain-containing protein [Candidatus Bathyarchaeia archaeon]
MSLVGLVKIQKGAFKNAILESLMLINYKIPAGAKRIVIKPNMCYYYDFSTGFTTDPKFVGALIELLREKVSTNPEISIVESDASAMRCKYAFKMLGYEELARKYGVNLVNLSEEEYEIENIFVGHHIFNIPVPKIIKNADLRVNVTKVKYTMPKIKLTCGLKNIFGCIPYPKKFVYHPILNEVIVSANKAMKFDLCILDGNMVYGAKVLNLGLVMASEDPVAFDSVAAKIAGIDPKSVKYLRLASKEGLGKMEFTVKGLPWKSFRRNFPRQTALHKMKKLVFDFLLLMHLESKLELN